MTINGLTKQEAIIAEKLNKLNTLNTFYDDVRKLTKNVRIDRTIKLWQRMADCRYAEILTDTEDVRIEIEIDKSGKFKRHYYNTNWEEVFPVITEN